MKNFPLINLVAFIALIVANFMAANGIVWQNTPGDISDLYATMFTPADFTFSIWSLIYLSLGVFIIRDFRSRRQNLNSEVKVISYWFALTCIFNIAWLFTWLAANIQIAFLFIFCLWASLAWLYYQLAIHKAKPIYTIPISLYLGWIAVSILAHLNVLLIDLNWAFLGMLQENWTILLVSIAIIGGLLMHYWNRDIVFNLVLIWAFIGTYSKHYDMDNYMVRTLILGMTVLTLASIYVGWRKMKSKALEKEAIL